MRCNNCVVTRVAVTRDALGTVCWTTNPKASRKWWHYDDDRKCHFGSTEDKWIDQKYMQVDEENMEYNDRANQRLPRRSYEPTSEPSSCNLEPIFQERSAHYRRDTNLEYSLGRPSPRQHWQGCYSPEGHKKGARSHSSTEKHQSSIFISVYEPMVTYNSCNSVYWRPSLWRMLISPLILSRIMLLVESTWTHLKTRKNEPE